MLFHMVNYWDIAHQLMSPYCSWKIPKETITLELLGCARWLQAGESILANILWAIPFLLKYGLKMEVLTAEGHSTGSFPWKGGREGGGSGWRRRGRGRRLSGQRKKGGVKAEQEWERGRTMKWSSALTHIPTSYIFLHKLSGERRGCSEAASSVTLKSKAKLFLNIERKSHKTMLCNSELSSHVQLHS